MPRHEQVTSSFQGVPRTSRHCDSSGKVELFLYCQSQSTVCSTTFRLKHILRPNTSESPWTSSFSLPASGPSQSLPALPGDTFGVSRFSLPPLPPPGPPTQTLRPPPYPPPCGLLSHRSQSDLLKCRSGNFRPLLETLQAFPVQLNGSQRPLGPALVALTFAPSFILPSS